MRPWNVLVATSLLATLASVAPRVKAQDAATTADVRCMIVAIRLMKVPDPKKQLAGQDAMLYYLGRLDGRGEKLNLESLIAKQAEHMTFSDYKAAAHRCGEKLKARGRQIIAMGQDMAEHQHAQATPKR